MIAAALNTFSRGTQMGDESSVSVNKIFYAPPETRLHPCVAQTCGVAGSGLSRLRALRPPGIGAGAS